MAEVVLAIAAVGAAGLEASEASDSAQAQKHQAQQNRDYNVKLAQNKAEQERLNREKDARQQRAQDRRQREKIKSQMLAGGASLSGTPEEMLLKQVETNQINIGQSALESEQRMAGAFHEQQMAEYQYNVLKSNIKRERRSRYIDIGTGLVNTAGMIGGMSSETESESGDSDSGGGSE